MLHQLDKMIAPAAGLLLVVIGAFFAHSVLISPRTIGVSRVATTPAPAFVAENWADPRDLMLLGCASQNNFWILLIGTRALTDSSHLGAWRIANELQRANEASMKAESQILYLRGDLDGCEQMSIRLRVIYGQPWTGTLRALRDEFTRVGIYEHLRAIMPDAFATVPPDTKREREFWRIRCRANVTLEDTKRILKGQLGSKSEFDTKLAACG